MNDKNTLLRNLPSVDRLLNEPSLRDLSDCIPQALRAEAARQTVAALRSEVLAGMAPDLSAAVIAARAAALARAKAAPALRRVLNLTGTLLHTNLGRAPLAPAAIESIDAVSRGYSNLEFDLESGERGHRYSHVEELLRHLSGAEAATVVNNNAGAVLLALTALAKGKEAIVSRGEMIEIGGAFRVPEVMAAGGVILCEVGTTNKTHLRDYVEAIGEETGLLLKVHTSNYRIVGFTASVSAAEMVELGRERGIPVMEDLGSGMLIDLSSFGLPREPTVAEAVAAGIDVVTFSGDKLLGGPQAGIIVGRRDAVEKIRRHPMARALRSDKLTLAALETTLRLYLDPRRALAEIPVLRMLAVPEEELKKRCLRLRRSLRSACGERLQTSVVPETSTVGGGALPLTELPGYALALTAAGLSADALAARLRTGDPPVVGRIREDRLLLNPRTLSGEEEKDLIRAVSAALSPE
jgi:L-seryl-tRNA(Ser) seleniumtransferase